MKPGVYLEKALKDVLRTSNLACSVFYHSIYAYSSSRELSALIINSTFLQEEYPVFTQAYEKQTAILDDVAAKQKAAREAKQKEMLEARRAALLAAIA